LDREDVASKILATGIALPIVSYQSMVANRTPFCFRANAGSIADRVRISWEWFGNGKLEMVGYSATGGWVDLVW